MSRTTNLVLGIVLVLVGVLGIAVVSLGGRPGGVSSVCPGGACGRVPVSPPARMSRASGVDAMFIEQMIPHHEMGIMMSRMAGNATGRDEIRELTDAIIRGQSDEIEKMRTWYQEWYGR